MNSKPIYIFDLDGTLSDAEHRRHFVTTHPADWRAFFAACKDDPPIPEVIRTAQLLRRAEAMIVIMSGRSEEVRFETLRWLEKYGVDCDVIYLRQEGDRREDFVVKGEFMDHFLTKYKREDIVAIFEDRKQVVDAFRARGFRVFQVAEGNF